jgi:uncharacterized membrane protein YheB (UPF0754 family)
MHILNWLLPPVLGAAIAFSTNWIAILMLFRPHREKRIFGLRIPFTPGLVPREKARLARKLGGAISAHLLTPEVLADALADPERWPLPDCTVGELLDKWDINPADFIRALPQRFPELDKKLADLTRQVVTENLSGLASLFVNKDKIYENIKEGLIKYLSGGENQDAPRENFLSLNLRESVQALPLHKALTFLAAYVAQHIPIADMIERKMASYDVAEAEAMILAVVGRELKVIVMLGGVFGFLIGLLSLIPLLSS